MRTVEHVKLTADAANYIATKFAVMEVTVGNGLGSSYAWLKCISLGIDSEINFNTLKAEAEAGTGTIDLSNLTGVIGTYSTVALTAIVPYSAPSRFEFSNVKVG